MNIPNDHDWECDDPEAQDEDYQYAKDRWKGKSLSDIEKILRDQSVDLSSLLEDLKNMPQAPFEYYFPFVCNYMITFTDFSFVYNRFEFSLDLEYMMRIVIHYLNTKECSKLWESFHDLVNFSKTNVNLFDEYRNGQFRDSLINLEKLTAEADNLLAIMQKENPI